MPKPKSRSKSTQTKKDMALASGLLADGDLAQISAYPSELLTTIRRHLSAKCSRLSEKFNPNSKYSGYSNGGSDGLYLYLQKSGLCIDIRLSVDREDELRSMGFDVRSRNNYQARMGWLTGWRVPYETSRVDEILSRLQEALTSEENG